MLGFLFSPKRFVVRGCDEAYYEVEAVVAEEEGNRRGVEFPEPPCGGEGEVAEGEVSPDVLAVVSCEEVPLATCGSCGEEGVMVEVNEDEQDNLCW
ncbi:hypothetical protein EC957_003015 [Mortierella hygrophila]|uniref:Uncharacterized protein n=1 Tax=Mortierella hygrophila TaxID=979708 RepID=A0A9P6K174_9FUNG|nr:hypothetical protein EC957_003015 [Mortierella hygrophila]